jgi:hypothetical protein
MQLVNKNGKTFKKPKQVEPDLLELTSLFPRGTQVTISNLWIPSIGINNSYCSLKIKIFNGVAFKSAESADDMFMQEATEDDIEEHKQQSIAKLLNPQKNLDEAISTISMTDYHDE